MEFYSFLDPFCILLLSNPLSLLPHYNEHVFSPPPSLLVLSAQDISQIIERE